MNERLKELMAQDVKITFTTTDLSDKSVTSSYLAYLSEKNIKKEAQNFLNSGLEFMIMNSKTGEVLAKSL